MIEIFEFVQYEFNLDIRLPQRYYEQRDQLCELHFFNSIANTKYSYFIF